MKFVVEVNLPQTIQVLVAHNLVIDEKAEDGPLVDVLADDVLDLLPPEGRLLLEDTVGEEPKHPRHSGLGATSQHLLAPQHLWGGGQ